LNPCHGAILRGIPPELPPLHPGAHVILVTEDERDAVVLRCKGLEFRDTILIVGPEGSRYGLLFRMPMHDTVMEQVLSTGTGALNIDGCRVGLGGDKGSWPVTSRKGRQSFNSAEDGSLNSPVLTDQSQGRWPSNLVFIHGEGCKPEGSRKVKGQAARGLEATQARSVLNASIAGISRVGYAGEDGMESVPVWACVDECPVKALDEQSGVTTNTRHMSYKRSGEGFIGSIADDPDARWWVQETGSCSRFFPQFQSEGELLDWFRKLITPPGGELYEM
jgi:hypothetical protein